MVNPSVINYLCSCLAILVLLLRDGLHLWQRKHFDVNCGLAILSIFVVIGRVVASEIYMAYGYQTLGIALPGAHPTAQDVYKYQITNICILLARWLLTLLIWLQMSILLNFYTTILSGITFVRHMIKFIWASLVVSFVAITLVTFLECSPINLYWAISPEEPKCRRAEAQLLLLGVSNVLIDLMLLFITYPLVIIRGRTWSQSLRLYGLFGLGFFCIVVTVVRTTLVFEDSGSSQRTRTLWAEVQVAVCTVVANVPSIYGSIRVAKRQRSSQRSGAQYSSPFHDPHDPHHYHPHHHHHLHRPSAAHRATTYSDFESWLRLDDDPTLAALGHEVSITSVGAGAGAHRRRGEQSPSYDMEAFAQDKHAVSQDQKPTGLSPLSPAHLPSHGRRGRPAFSYLSDATVEDLQR